MNDTSTLIVGCAFGSFLLTIIIAGIADHIKYRRKLEPDHDPKPDGI